jgi:hypothetical protein
VLVTLSSHRVPRCFEWQSIRNSAESQPFRREFANHLHTVISPCFSCHVRLQTHRGQFSVRDSAGPSSSDIVL